MQLKKPEEKFDNPATFSSLIIPSIIITFSFFKSGLCTGATLERLF